MAKATLAKGSRISGDQRATLASQYAERYTGGESIRAIAEDAGRSYGFVHNVLKESGVTLRGRGGATRGVRGSAAGAKTASSAPKAETTTAKAGKKAKAVKADKAKADKGRSKDDKGKDKSKDKDKKGGKKG